MATFILPIIIAVYLVNHPLYGGKHTHKGRLLSQTTHLKEIAKTPEKADKNKWLLIHYQPTQCLKDCQKSLQQLEWLYDILGKNQHHTQLIYLAKHPLTSLSAKWLYLPTRSKVHQSLPPHSLRIIADPLQRPTLTYPLSQPIRDMLKDLKKLLTFSRSL